jgi:hypothetical protein
MNTLSPHTTDEFTWYFELEMGTLRSQCETESRNGTLDGTIRFTVRNTEQGGWTADATEIEAALSLWIYLNECDRWRSNMDENNDTTIENEKKSDWLQNTQTKR